MGFSMHRVWPSSTTLDFRAREVADEERPSPRDVQTVRKHMRRGDGPGLNNPGRLPIGSTHSKAFNRTHCPAACHHPRPVVSQSLARDAQNALFRFSTLSAFSVQ